MARLLFLVHGMGHHEDAADPWHASPLSVLREAAASYGLADRFDAEIQPHDITYDGVLRRYLDQMGGSIEDLRAAMQQNATDGLEVISWLDDRDVTATEKNFFWSHVVDVLLYRFFPQIAAEVRSRVLTRFVGVVNEARDAAPPQPRAAILAHSLGTSVIHDSLADLATRPFNGSGAYMASTGWKLHYLFALANVSRVLSRLGPGFYDSTVRCQTAPPVAGVRPCVARYLNFRHRLDPIPAVKSFAPAGWGADFHAQDSLDHLLEWNVHGFEHYLRHPDVHVPILNELLDFPITEEQRKDAVAALAEAPRPECVDVAGRLRVQLRRVRDLVRSTATVDTGAAVVLIKAATETLALIKEAEDACKELTA